MKNDSIAIPADPDDPEDRPISRAGLEQGNRAFLIRGTRIGLGLSQPQFAERYHIPVGTLRDWEQARSMPPDYVMAYIRLIERDPEGTARAVA